MRCGRGDAGALLGVLGVVVLEVPDADDDDEEGVREGSRSSAAVGISGRIYWLTTLPCPAHTHHHRRYLEQLEMGLPFCDRVTS